MSLTPVLVPTAALVPDPENARRHNAENVAAIAASLATFGQRRPLVVTPDHVVVAGNGTLEAARSLGWREIVVTVLPEDWTPDQAKAYAIADNRTGELGEWKHAELARALEELEAAGFEMAAVGFTPIEEPDDDDWAAALEAAGRDRGGLGQAVFTLTAEQLDTVLRAIEAEGGPGERSGAVVARIAAAYLEGSHGGRG